MRRLAHDEAGAVGGLEVLPFGVLVFVTGTLLVASAWGAVDARLAAATAAREAARAAAETAATGGGDTAVEHAARRAAVAVLHGAGRTSARPAAEITVTDISPTGTGPRCRTFAVEVEASVPAVRLPFVGTWGRTTVRARRRDHVDPFARGGRGEGVCDA